MSHRRKILFAALMLVAGSVGTHTAHAADAQASLDLSGLSLYYKWDWAGSGAYHGAYGWAAGLYSPYVQVNYHATITNLDTGQNVQSGAIVPVGSHLRLSFTPHVYNDIYWFGIGASDDSPYGDWIAGAGAPALSCDAKDFVSTYYNYNDYFSNQYTQQGQPTKLDVFVPLSIDPPTEAITSTGALSCGSLSTSADGGYMDCTVTAQGNYSPIFNFAQTYGKFYYRYKNYATYPSDMHAPPPGTCMANNQAMREFYPPIVCFGGCPTPDTQPDYLLNVPSQQISIPFSTGTISWPDLKADTPANISGVSGQAANLTTTMRNVGNGSTNAPFPATLWVTQDTTSNGTAVKVWQGSTALGIPNGYPAGYSEPVSSTWTPSAAGTYYYRFCVDDDASWNGVIAESDETNNCSGWGTATVLVNAADLTAGAITPTTATAGTPVTLSSTALNQGGVASGSFPMLFMIGVTTFDYVQSSYLSGLAPNASAPASVSYTFPGPGTYTVRACANMNSSFANIVTESDYSNNCGPWGTITVTSGPATNLSCTVSNANPPLNTAVTYTASGASAPYTWTAADGGSYGTNSTASRSFSAAGSYAMTVSKSGYTSATCPIVTAGNGAQTCTNPTLSLSGAPTRIKPGSTTQVTYSATGVASCTLTGPGAPATTPNSCSLPQGSFTTPALTKQTVYTLTCDGVTKTLIINVLPNIVEF